MAAARRAEATWNGDLMSGSGAVSGVSSGAFTALPVTWPSRAEQPDGRTSPEELIAAAHAACYSMALSMGLAMAGTPPTRLEVSAEVTLEVSSSGAKVTSSALTVRGEAPGVSPTGFVEAAEAAKDQCPVSQALQNNVTLSVEASLG